MLEVLDETLVEVDKPMKDMISVTLLRVCQS